MMKIGGSFANKYNYRQIVSRTIEQQKFIDLMKSNREMFKSWEYLHGDTIETYAQDVTPNTVPAKALCTGSEWLKMAKYPIENLLKAAEGFKTFKYKTLEKIYDNPAIMQDCDTRETFIGLLGKAFAHIDTEFLPEQEEIMNKFLDNERLYGCKEYFKYTKNSYNISDIFGRLFRVKSNNKDKERAQLSNEILQGILDNKNLNENQVTEILRIMSHARTKDNQELKIAKALVEDDLLPKERLKIDNKWFDLKWFLARTTMKWWQADELVKEFRSDEKVRDNKPFQDALSAINDEYFKEHKC